MTGPSSKKPRKRVKPGRPGGYDGPLAIWYAWRDDAGSHEETGPSLPDAEIASDVAIEATSR